jgi:hypothetical protein
MPSFIKIFILKGLQVDIKFINERLSENIKVIICNNIIH